MNEVVRQIATPGRYAVGPLREFLMPMGALLASVFLPFTAIASAYIVVGHAHFLMAYRYQAKAGKMTFRYIGTALVLLFLAIAYLTSTMGIVPILIVAGTLFAFHFALDEFTLHGEAYSSYAYLTAGGFALLFAALIVAVVSPAFSYLGTFAALMLGAGILVRLVSTRGRISKAERYLFLVEALLFVLAVPFHMPDRILGVILLLHFLNWYVGYGARVRGTASKAREYWMTVVITLFIPGVLYTLFLIVPVPVLGIFFSLSAYYAWAIAHILLSFVTAPWKRFA